MSNILIEVQEFYKSAVFNCWLNKRGADVLGDIVARHSKDTEPLAGDIEIHHGTINSHGEMVDDYDLRMFVDVRLQGKQGQLIFRPTKTDRGEK